MANLIYVQRGVNSTRNTQRPANKTPPLNPYQETKNPSLRIRGKKHPRGLPPTRISGDLIKKIRTLKSTKGHAQWILIAKPSLQFWFCNIFHSARCAGRAMYISSETQRLERQRLGSPWVSAIAPSLHVPHHSPSTPKIGGLSVRNHPSMCNCVVLLANEKCF